MTHSSRVRSVRFSGFALLLLAGCSGEGMTSEEAEAVGSQSEALLVSSALDCPNGVGSACTVPNMPLLHQKSESVDVDIRQGVKNNGCYDTSITTIMSMALTNRADRAPALKNRTATFHSTKAGNNGANPPLATTREQEQLSQQYRWSQIVYDQQMAVPPVNPILDQNFYFTEILSDFSGTRRSYPTTCDLRTYGSCAWSTLVQSNGAGAAFRDTICDVMLVSPKDVKPEVYGCAPATTKVSHMTDDYVKTLMSEGFGVLAAYGRYIPSPCPDNLAKTCFTRDSQHKVVFSGTQPGAYPLRINDVGDGKQYKVTVSDDQSLFGRTNATTRAPNGTSAQTFLLYEGKNGANAEVFFLDHMDGFSLNLNSNKGITTTMDQTWGAGFTNLMPFTMNGQPHLLAYNKNTGAVQYNRFLAEANGLAGIYNSKWGAGFAHFAPYTVNNSPHFVAYNSTTGELQFEEIPQNLQGLNVKAITSIPKDFTIVMPFTKNGTNYMLFYNKGTGAVRFDAIDSAGSSSTPVYSSTWGTGFTDFVPYYIGGEPYFVAYNASTGQTQFERIKTRPSSGIDVLVNFWDVANRKYANVAFQGPAHITTYDPSGTTWVSRMTFDGKDGAAVWRDTLLPSATSIISFIQDGKTYQLMYDAVSGKARSSRFNLF